MTFTETEQKILAAATEVFLQKGKDGSRMQEIARKAGINQAMLHYYFRSKDRLYETVLAHLIRNFMQHILLSIPKTDDIRQLLNSFISHYIDQISRNIELLRFILWEIERGGELFVREIRRIFSEHGFQGPPFIDVIQQAIRKGQIRAVDPLQFVLSVIGMCVYPFIARPIVETMFSIPDITDETFLRRRKQEIFELIWHGIQINGTPNETD